MDQDKILQDLIKRYKSGERDFCEIDLRHQDLRGVNLSGANLTKADLYKADLKGANLSNTQLEGACMNEAALDDANLNHAQLSGALLLKTRLIKANLKRADLTKTHLSGSLLLHANLEEANLDGAYLNGISIFSTNCKRAYYTDTTYFDSALNPDLLGMQKLKQEMRKTPLDKILSDFNYLSEVIAHYMGKMMMTKYWEKSRPQVKWLENFSIDSRTKKIYYTNPEDFINVIQRQDCQEWANKFVVNCSKIVHNLPSLIEADHLLLQLSWIEEAGEPEALFC